MGSGPLSRIHWDRTPDHRDMASRNDLLDGGIGVTRSYDQKRDQKRFSGDRFFWAGWMRLAAATSASHNSD